MTLHKYRCHKEVRAMKIVAIKECGYTWHCELTGEDGTVVRVDNEYMTRKPIMVGGYYIDDNGRTTYSPAEAFEAGYTLIEDDSK